jgi:hypothetical protein
MFCESPMVIRVGEPQLQFIIHNKPNKIIEYIHYDEFGTNVSQDNLIEIGYGFYYYTPVISTLGYIEIYGKPSVINLPYCSSYAGVAIDIEWTKKVIKRFFGTKTLKQKFNQIILKENINTITIKEQFNKKVKKEQFSTKIIKRKFKAKSC